MDNCDEIVNMVEHLQQNGKSIEEIYLFCKSLYEYITILYDPDYSSESEVSSEEEENTIKEKVKVKQDEEGFFSID